MYNDLTCVLCKIQKNVLYIYIYIYIYIMEETHSLGKHSCHN
jgi:hypothetical protein